MDEQDIRLLLKQGEGKKVEFKSSFKSDAIESIVAFANSKGEVLLIGVQDDAGVIGVTLGKESLQNYLNQIKQNTSPALIPDIDVVTIQGKIILVISILEYPVKPVSYKGRYYKRVHNSNHLMTPTEIADIHLKMLNLSWDAHLYPNGGIEALDTKKIDKFIENINQTGRFSIEEDRWATLQKLRLIKDSKPTIASMFLFAKVPERAHIRVGRFKDDITIIDDRQITDTLFEAVEETMKFIKTYMMVSYEFHGELKRVEKWDYPINALREAVLNAIVHRDYQDPSDIQIKIYDDKIVIANPGKLYGNITLEKLKSKNYQSSLRNKLMAEAFYLTGNIEKYGSGFIRIENELKEYPQVSFEFKEIANAMQMTFYKKSNVGVNVGVNSVFEYIKQNQPTKAKYIAQYLGVTQRTVERYLKELKNEGKIEFRGSPKTGGYYAK